MSALSNVRRNEKNAEIVAALEIKTIKDNIENAGNRGYEQGLGQGLGQGRNEAFSAVDKLLKEISQPSSLTEGQVTQREADQQALSNNLPISNSQIANENRAGINRSLEQTIKNRMLGMADSVKDKTRSLYDTVMNGSGEITEKEARNNAMALEAKRELDEYENKRFLLESKLRGERK